MNKLMAKKETHHDMVNFDINGDHEIEYLDHSKTTDNTLEVEPRFLNEPFKVGNCIAFCYFNANPLFTIGPDWQNFICLNLFVITLSSVFLTLLISEVNTIATVVGWVILIFQVFSSIMTGFINPGLPDFNFNKPGAVKVIDKRYCVEMNVG